MVQASVMWLRRLAQVGLRMGFLAAMATTAGAQGMLAPCDTRAKVVAHLADKFGETVHGMGFAANNTVMEVYVSDASGTWTIAVTLPTGITCLVASGGGVGWDGTDLAPERGARLGTAREHSSGLSSGFVGPAWLELA